MLELFKTQLLQSISEENWKWKSFKGIKVTHNHKFLHKAAVYIKGSHRNAEGVWRLNRLTEVNQYWRFTYFHITKNKRSRQQLWKAIKKKSKNEANCTHRNQVWMEATAVYCFSFLAESKSSLINPGMTWRNLIRLETDKRTGELAVRDEWTSHHQPHTWTSKCTRYSPSNVNDL